MKKLLIGTILGLSVFALAGCEIEEIEEDEYMFEERELDESEVEDELEDRLEEENDTDLEVDVSEDLD